MFDPKSLIVKYFCRDKLWMYLIGVVQTQCPLKAPVSVKWDTMYWSEIWYWLKYRSYCLYYLDQVDMFPYLHLHSLHFLSYFPLLLSHQVVYHFSISFVIVYRSALKLNEPCFFFLPLSLRLPFGIALLTVPWLDHIIVDSFKTGHDKDKYKIKLTKCQLLLNDHSSQLSATDIDAE